jgi:hypothetical protein
MTLLAVVAPIASLLQGLGSLLGLGGQPPKKSDPLPPPSGLQVNIGKDIGMTSTKVTEDVGVKTASVGGAVANGNGADISTSQPQGSAVANLRFSAGIGAGKSVGAGSGQGPMV